MYINARYDIRITRLFQLSVDKHQQQKASLEPVSRLQSLRDRDTIKSFDLEVSATLKCGYTLSF